MEVQASRYPKRCKGCMYVLDGLPSGPCPECARTFDPAVRATYFFGPIYSRWRFWGPGLALAIVAGGLSIGSLLGMGSLGGGLVIATPLMIGALLGYGTRTARVIAPVLLALACIAGLVMMLFTWQLAGLLCGVILVAIFALPVVAGLMLGVLLRVLLRESRFSMREYLPIVVMCLLPAIVGFVEKKGFSESIEVVATRRSLQISSAQAWESLQFYEETRSAPPVLLRLTIPLPQECSGARAAPGDVTVCTYEGGHLTKRIAEAQRPNLLVFDVIGQQIEFDGAIRLRSGAFHFTDGPGDTTVAMLETTYRSALRPRWVWRWGEDLVVHTLHNHVLEAIETDALEKATRRASVGSEGP